MLKIQWMIGLNLEMEWRLNMIYLPQFDRERNGSLYDCGSADCHYGRKRDPHWWTAGTMVGEKITDLTEEEVFEYHLGYSENDTFKLW